MTRLLTIAPFRHLALTLFCANALILTVSSALAQQARPQSPGTSPPKSSMPFPSPSNLWDQNAVVQRGNNKLVSPLLAKKDNCFLPPLNALPSASVEIADLKVPSNAQKEHRDGCASLRSGNMVAAEVHLRKAVKRWPKYSAAWVVLGQLLEAQQKAEEAYGSCSQALATDPNYLPAYLCLADVSAHSESWDRVLQFSTRALEIDSTNDALAYDYHAAANFHLHRLPEAEKSALRAAEIDKSNADPRVHFLLAQIYEAKGDRESEASQLREYLKYASDPKDAAMVSRYLSELEKLPE